MSQSELTSALMSDFAATGSIFICVALNYGRVRAFVLCESARKGKNEGGRKSCECLLGDSETACPAMRGHV